MQGKITHVNPYLLEYVEPKGLSLKSLAGVIYTDPSVYSSYPDKFLDDGIFKILLKIYETAWNDRGTRLRVINLLNDFFEGKISKTKLEKELKKIKLPPSPSDGFIPSNEKRISLSKEVNLYSSGEGRLRATKSTISVEVEETEYIFSEGVKYRAFREILDILEKHFPYMKGYVEAVNNLEPLFEGKMLNTLTDVISKTLLIFPVFGEVKENEVVYSLKLVNIHPQLKLQKLFEAFEQVLSNLKGELKNEKSPERKKVLEEVVKVFEANRGNVEKAYKDRKVSLLLYIYLGLKMYKTLKLNGLWSKEIGETVKENLKKLATLWATQVQNWQKFKKFLIETGDKISEGTHFGQYTLSLTEEIGRVVVFEKLNASPLEGFLKFKKYPYETLIFRPLETLGDLIDVSLVANVLSIYTDSIILSIPQWKNDLSYKRLKAVLNLFLNNQTITERGYKALRYGSDNLLRSLQKVRRVGVVNTTNKLKGDVLVIIETHPSNRIAEVSKEEFEERNEQTAHRLFRLVFLSQAGDGIEVESLGFVGFLAGDFASTEMVKGFSSTPKVDRVVFITTTTLSKKNAEEIAERILNTSPKSLSVVNLEEINFILTSPLEPKRCLFIREGEGIAFLKPIPSAVRNAVNETGLVYRFIEEDKIDREELVNIFTVLHLFFSDSRNFPFANLKLSKQRLGYLPLKNRKIAFSIALIETFMRLKRLSQP